MDYGAQFFIMSNGRYGQANKAQFCACTIRACGKVQLIDNDVKPTRKIYKAPNTLMLYFLDFPERW